jgi:hypothetical protein
VWNLNKLKIWEPSGIHFYILAVVKTWYLTLKKLYYNLLLQVISPTRSLSIVQVRWITLYNNLLRNFYCCWFKTCLPSVHAFFLNLLHYCLIRLNLSAVTTLCPCSYRLAETVSDLQPLTGLLFIPRWYIRYRSHGGMIVTGDNRRTHRKSVPVSLCVPQIPHGLTHARIRASELRLRRLTAWTKSRPHSTD